MGFCTASKAYITISLEGIFSPLVYWCGAEDEATVGAVVGAGQWRTRSRFDALRVRKYLIARAHTPGSCERQRASIGMEQDWSETLLRNHQTSTTAREVNRGNHTRRTGCTAGVS